MATKKESTSRRFADRGAKTAREVLRGTERIASGGLDRVKGRAGQADTVGQATYRALELVHGGLGGAARGLGRLQEAMKPPTRKPAIRIRPSK